MKAYQIEDILRNLIGYYLEDNNIMGLIKIIDMIRVHYQDNQTDFDNKLKERILKLRNFLDDNRDITKQQ